jgi:hypothetical protein
VASAIAQRLFVIVIGRLQHTSGAAGIVDLRRPSPTLHSTSLRWPWHPSHVASTQLLAQGTGRCAQLAPQCSPQPTSARARPSSLIQPSRPPRAPVARPIVRAAPMPPIARPAGGRSRQSFVRRPRIVADACSAGASAPCRAHSSIALARCSSVPRDSETPLWPRGR